MNRIDFPWSRRRRAATGPVTTHAACAADPGRARHGFRMAMGGLLVVPALQLVLLRALSDLLDRIDAPGPASGAGGATLFFGAMAVIAVGVAAAGFVVLYDEIGRAGLRLPVHLRAAPVVASGAAVVVAAALAGLTWLFVALAAVPFAAMGVAGGLRDALDRAGRYRPAAPVLLHHPRAQGR